MKTLRPTQLDFTGLKSFSLKNCSVKWKSAFYCTLFYREMHAQIQCSKIILRCGMVITRWQPYFGINFQHMQFFTWEADRNDWHCESETKHHVFWFVQVMLIVYAFVELQALYKIPRKKHQSYNVVLTVVLKDLIWRPNVFGPIFTIYSEDLYVISKRKQMEESKPGTEEFFFVNGFSKN